MRTTTLSTQSRWSNLQTRFQQLFAASALSVGMTATALLPAAAAGAEVKPATATSERLPDGVYLYGQSKQPQQIGQGYFVFEVTQGTVIGALYMPSSSFDCASGKFESEELALTVVNSYDRTTNPFEIALNRDYTVATGGNPVLEPVGLQGFHRLASVTENDQRMLNVCKTDLQQQAKRQ